MLSMSTMRTALFLSTLSVRRATPAMRAELAMHLIFLSTLSVRRATVNQVNRFSPIYLFLSTLSVRRATVVLFVHFCDIAISIHALREESDLRQKGRLLPVTISIHALREESDYTKLTMVVNLAVFLSTLSVRRATVALKAATIHLNHFYPRSP